MSWRTTQKVWIAVCKVKVTARVQMINDHPIFFYLLILFASKVCIIISQRVVCKVCNVVFKVKVTMKVCKLSECLLIL